MDPMNEHRDPSGSKGEKMLNSSWSILAYRHERGKESWTTTTTIIIPLPLFLQQTGTGETNQRQQHRSLPTSNQRQNQHRGNAFVHTLKQT
jgi:hypothetical protein